MSLPLLKGKAAGLQMWQKKGVKEEGKGGPEVPNSLAVAILPGAHSPLAVKQW